MLATFCSAYLQGDPRALAFLPADFRDPQARCRVTRAAAQRRLQPQLLAALTEQNRRLGRSPAREEHLQALAEPGPAGTAVVVTGQQVGLFLGPLYTVYKAATAIAVARTLQAESGVRCVPLFWLQTEDHDYEEIHHCDVPRYAAPPLRLQLPASPLARVSVAHRCLGPAVTEQLDALTAALGGLPHAAPFLDRLRAHYRPEATLGQAFAGVLGELFADEGLLLLEPRQPAIAALAAPLYRQSIVQQEAIAAALLERQARLHAAGCAEQIPTRAGSTLVFFHPDGVAGPRYRLERVATAGAAPPSWSVPSGSSDASEAPASAAAAGRRVFTQAEVLEVLAAEPLRFSSSALLRPVIQDSLLPTAAYVGGPGEINYFSQLAPLYELLGVAQPLVLPRARFRCLEDNTRSWLAKLGLTPAEAETPRAELLRRLAARTPQERPAAAALRERMLADITARLGELEALDSALRDPVRRARESIERTVGRLTERYAQALLERDHVTTERVDRVQGFLFPDGVPQERLYSLPYFACKYGARTFIQKLFSHLRDAEVFVPVVRSVEL
jgi:uncharacterized protein YllA (UPF0747 family)